MTIESNEPLVRGRPRSEVAHQSILRAALDEVVKYGFRSLTVDAIAAKAGVGKMTVYRRWPNKAAIVMEAFLTLIGPLTAFPEHKRAITSIKLQMRLQAQFFLGKYGHVIKALLGEAQFDAELAIAFRDQWIVPRREMTKKILKQAIEQGDIKGDSNLELIVDMLYAPIYYRLQIGSGAINEELMDQILQKVLIAFKS